MNKLNLQKIEFQQKIYPGDFSEKEKELLEKALDAAYKAYCPYSKFAVGCAVLLSNDIIITGSNQENSSYPTGMCAERVALFYAGAQFPNVRVQSLFIAAPKAPSHTIIAPCGSCRQVIYETILRQKSECSIYFPSDKDIWIHLPDARHLLPWGFTLRD